MFFHCPNCLTCFRLKPVKIGPQGRKVRCSQCGGVWFQEQSIGRPKFDVINTKKEFKTTNAKTKLINFVFKKGMVARVLWMLGCGIFSVVLISTYVEREIVLSKFPKSSEIFSFFRMLPEPGAGLSIQDYSIKVLSENGGARVKIEGEIVNLSKVTKIVPKLLGIIQNEKGEELQRWVFNSPFSKLRKQERVKFTTSFLNPPLGNLVFVITFDGKKNC